MSVDLDEDESRRLAAGEVALTDEHLYYAFGEIDDVYLVRARADDAAYPFDMLRYDPLNDVEGPVLFRVAREGRLYFVSVEGDLTESSFDMRALQPFGADQLGWLRAGLA
jgi:hypothetical protein